MFPKVTIPPPAAPTNGLPVTTVPVMKVARLDIDMGKDSPTTDNTALGLLAIALNTFFQPFASTICFNASATSFGWLGDILFNSAINLIACDWSCIPRLAANNDIAWFALINPLNNALFGKFESSPSLTLLSAINLIAVSLSIFTSPLSVLRVKLLNDPPTKD